jgi:hypothetical protein
MANLIRTIKSRNINGSYTSPSIKCPVLLNKKIYLTTILTDNQFTNPLKSMEFKIEVSDDGINWKFKCGFGWTGGVRYKEEGLPDTNRPGIVFSPTNSFSDKYIRVKIDTPSVLNVGLTIEYE